MSVGVTKPSRDRRRFDPPVEAQICLRLPLAQHPVVLLDVNTPNNARYSRIPSGALLVVTVAVSIPVLGLTMSFAARSVPDCSGTILL